jgi:hypothetical protein
VKKPCLLWRWEKSPAERAAWLDFECAGDAELRARLEALLAAHDGYCVGQLSTGGVAPVENQQLANSRASCVYETRTSSLPVTSRSGGFA